MLFFINFKENQVNFSESKDNQGKLREFFGFLYFLDLFMFYICFIYNVLFLVLFNDE